MPISYTPSLALLKPAAAVRIRWGEIRLGEYLFFGGRDVSRDRWQLFSEKSRRQSFESCVWEGNLYFPYSVFRFPFSVFSFCIIFADKSKLKYRC